VDGARGDTHAGGQSIQLPVGRLCVRHRAVRAAQRPAALHGDQQQGPDHIHGGQGLSEARPEEGQVGHAARVAQVDGELYQVRQGRQAEV